MGNLIKEGNSGGGVRIFGRIEIPIMFRPGKNPEAFFNAADDDLRNRVLAQLEEKTCEILAGCDILSNGLLIAIAFEEWNVNERFRIRTNETTGDLDVYHSDSAWGAFTLSAIRKAIHAGIDEQLQRQFDIRSKIDEQSEAA